MSVVQKFLEGIGLFTSKPNGHVADAIKENVESHKKLDEVLTQIEKDLSLRVAEEALKKLKRKPLQL